MQRKIDDAAIMWNKTKDPKDKDEWSVISSFIGDFDSGKEVKPFTIEMERNC